MKINGKEVTLRADLKAIKDIDAATGKNFFALGEKDMSADVLSAMIYSFAKRGGSDVTMDDVDSMTLEELMNVQGEIEKLTSTGKTSKNVKKVSPQQ